MSEAVTGLLIRRLRALRTVHGVLLLWAVAGLSGLGLIAADVLLILPDDLRARTPWALIALALVVCGATIGLLRRLTPLRVARLFETAQPALGSGITNAVQLQASTPAAGVTGYLQQQAVAYGREQASALRVWPLLRRATLRLVGVGLLIGALWAGGPLLLPRVFGSVLPRFLDPYGDHPPYSPLEFAVELQSDSVIYGDQCEITCRVDGGAVEKLFLVAQDAEGRTQTVMFRRPDRSFSQTLTNLREPTTVWVTDGRARSRRRRIDIRYTPRLSLVELTTVFPAYTALPEQTRKLQETDLQLPAGSTLRLRVTSNRPLASGTIHITPLLGGERTVVDLLPVPEQPLAVEGAFTLREGVAFSVVVTDVDGLASTDPCSGRVTILPDRRPRLDVLEPGRDAVSTPEMTVPIMIQAEDDYGVANLLWFRQLNGSDQRPSPLALQPGPGRRVRASDAFDLKDLGVRPGDVIEYFFEAVDNFPDGPNVTTSRVYRIEIISHEAYLELLRRMQAGRDIAERYDALSQHLRRLLERARAAEEQRRALEAKDDPQQREALANELAAMQESLNDYRTNRDQALQGPPLFDLEKSLRERLQGQDEALRRLQKMLEQARQEMKQGGLPGSMGDLLNELANLAGMTEREVGEPARLLESVVRLLAEQQRFVQLAAQQAHLSKIARRFREPQRVLSRTDQMALQEIARQQELVRDGLGEFMERVPRLLAAVPDRPEFIDLRETTEAFLQAVRDAGIAGDLAAAAGGFKALDGPTGCPPCRRAAEAMDALLARSQGMSGMGESCLKFQPSIGSALGSSLQQILSALGADMQDGGNGYGLLGSDVSLFGPDVNLQPARGGSGRGDQDGTGEGGETITVAAGSGEDPHLPTLEGAPRVRLQRDARFPLRYRTLVGEYFRSIAEEADRELQPVAPQR